MRLEGASRVAWLSSAWSILERIWAYCNLMGRAAKTDRVDSRPIAEHAATLRPVEGLHRGASQYAMKGLPCRRDRHIEAITAEEKRLRRAKHDVVRGILEAQIASLERVADRTAATIADAVSWEEERSPRP